MTTTATSIRPARILARSLYRDLSTRGFDAHQIVAVATELIGEVTTHIGARRAAREGGQAAARPRGRATR